MKQGNTSRVDKGWERIKPILDKELPLEKKKRKRFLLWLFPLLVGLGIGGYLVFDTNPTAKTVHEAKNPIVATKTTNEQKATTSESLHKTENSSKQSTQTSEELTPLDKTNLNSAISKIRKAESRDTESRNTEYSQKSTVTKSSPFKNTSKQNIVESALNKTTTSTTTAIRQKAKTNSIEKTTIDQRQPNIVSNSSSKSKANSITPSYLNSDKIYAAKNENITVAGIPALLPNELSWSKINAFELKAEPLISATLATDAIVLENTNGFSPTLSLLGFYANQLDNYGTELSLGLESNKNKWNYGINVGAGYQFEISSQESFDADRDSLTLVPGGNRGERSLNSDYKYYLHLGISGGYSLISNLSINGMLGVEKYFTSRSSGAFSVAGAPAETEIIEVDIEMEDNNIFPENDLEPHTSSDNGINPYAQLALSYDVQSWSIGLGYRASLSSLFFFEEEKISAHKLFMSVKKSF